MDAVVLGLDFGSDAVRALVVDAASGAELAAASAGYPRWSTGRFCDPPRQVFRQHPHDYQEAMTEAVRQAVAAAGVDAATVVGIGIDTTGSTPAPVDGDGRPLALDPRFAEEPDAMFWLWKDHSAIAEAERINAVAADFSGVLAGVGGIYSSEWYWAKLLRCLRNGTVNAAIAGWVEHCDWMAALLCDAEAAAPARSRCAAGHKALWRDGALPDAAFFTAVDPLLTGWRERCGGTTLTCDRRYGGLSAAWAERLGLPVGIAVATGAFDAHLGAVGAGIAPGVLAKVMGTSTCDIAVARPADLGETTVRGICGQVDGSVLPGLIGLEAGQSSFGDVYAWFRDLLAWNDTDSDDILARLTEAAAALGPDEDVPVALDWFNGRRTPDADQRARAAITGLHLGIDAPRLFRALVYATACGARAIVDRFVSEGVAIERVRALGGIAVKNPFVMQVHADLFDRPIEVVRSTECCALGSAIAAAVAAGVHDDIAAAQQVMASPVARVYTPEAGGVARMRDYFRRYEQLAEAQR